MNERIGSFNIDFKNSKDRIAEASKKFYEDIFKAELVGSRIEDGENIAARRVGNHKKLIMTEYLRLRKEALQKLKETAHLNQ